MNRNTRTQRMVGRRLAACLLLAAPAAAFAGGNAASEPADRDRSMPAELYLAVARSRAAEVGAAYHIDRDGRGTNSRHDLDLTFTPRGARLDGRDGGFALRLERFGRGDGRPVRRAAPRIDGAWVAYDRGAGLIEWFVNLPRGVEQGWTVARRPAGRGPLVLELDTARPPDRVGEGRFAWSGIVYHRLKALDAAGRELPATLTHDGAWLRIEVDDREAAYPVLIDPWTQHAKLTATDGAAGDLVGFSVALESDTALVGAIRADVGGDSERGAVYVFTRSNGGWSPQAKLTAGDGAAHDHFGHSVALAGDSALVGAPGADTGGAGDQGAAYVFTRSSGVWSLQAKLIAADGVQGDFFGDSVALAGDSALVGATGAGFDTNKGAAYVFTRSNAVWSQQAKLIAADGTLQAAFGNSVALAGDTALVGAWTTTVDGHYGQGAAYVFTRSNAVWSQQAKLIAADGAALDFFGNSVALAGDSALVGTYGAAVGNNPDQGAAYVFTVSGGVWSQQAKLTSADGTVADFFGVSVALAGDTAVVGAPLADVGSNSDQGAAYVFTESGGVWSQQAKLTSADGTAADFFGDSVALAGDTALVGATGADVGIIEPGAAYAFAAWSFPVSLAVDYMPFNSDGNDVLEPGELVHVSPAWRNNAPVQRYLEGGGDDFTGPPGPAYELVRVEAFYGEPLPQETVSCATAPLGECYAVSVGSGPRPVQHWDATFDEHLSDGTIQTWTLHLGDSFADVPRTHPFYFATETLFHHGVTDGCGPGGYYCPGAQVTRAQMAVFVLRAKEGSDFVPPPCVSGAETFFDVPAGHPFCPWIEELFHRGVVDGCGGGNYCPGAPVTRAQMTVYLLKTLEGTGYTPPPCTDLFVDVACPSLFAGWIEDLFNRGVTSGCDASPPRYCPGAPITRGQAAVFQSRAFALSLYGP